VTFKISGETTSALKAPILIDIVASNTDFQFSENDCKLLKH